MKLFQLRKRLAKPKVKDGKQRVLRQIGNEKIFKEKITKRGQQQPYAELEPRLSESVEPRCYVKPNNSIKAASQSTVTLKAFSQKTLFASQTVFPSDTLRTSVMPYTLRIIEDNTARGTQMNKVENKNIAQVGKCSSTETAPDEKPPNDFLKSLAVMTKTRVLHDWVGSDIVVKQIYDREKHAQLRVAVPVNRSVRRRWRLLLALYLNDTPPLSAGMRDLLLEFNKLVAGRCIEKVTACGIIYVTSLSPIEQYTIDEEWKTQISKLQEPMFVKIACKLCKNIGT